MRISARVNIELDKPANYIPMGFWSATSDYYISDVGIPFVKREDGTALGYSVYALNVDKATKGSWIASQWRLLESAEFIYMQDAYIERLQAQLVTADKIESLDISTGNLTVTDGAKIAGLDVEGSVLVSANKKLVIDGLNNTIYLLDDNFKVKTVIRPNNIPTTVQNYFSGSIAKYGSITSLKGEFSDLSPRESASVSLDVSGGKAFEIDIPPITLIVTTDYFGGGIGSSGATATLHLTNGSTYLAIGSETVMSTGGTVNSTKNLPRKSVVVTTGGNWKLIVTLSSSSIGGGSHTSFGSLSSTATQFTATEILERSEIGSNGMMIATSAQNYNFMVGGVFEIRRGNFGLRVSSNGFEKTSNGTTWVASNL